MKSSRASRCRVRARGGAWATRRRRAPPEAARAGAIGPQNGALASAYAGQCVGPAALPVDGALADDTRRGIVATLVREGCIGETVAALEAAEAREHATDPVVRAVLQQIAADETRHAELAWRALRWALDSDNVELARAVGEELEAALYEPAPRVERAGAIDEERCSPMAWSRDGCASSCAAMRSNAPCVPARARCSPGCHRLRDRWRCSFELRGSHPDLSSVREQAEALAFTAKVPQQPAVPRPTLAVRRRACTGTRHFRPAAVSQDSDCHPTR